MENYAVLSVFTYGVVLADLAISLIHSIQYENMKIWKQFGLNYFQKGTISE